MASALTPLKQITDDDNELCLVCGKVPAERRIVENNKTIPGTDLKIPDLLLKYGGINVQCGTICRNCLERAKNLHKKCTEFYLLCQKNVINSRIKRMASTPDSNNHQPPKKINITLPEDGDDCESPIPEFMTTLYDETDDSGYEEVFTGKPIPPTSSSRTDHDHIYNKDATRKHKSECEKAYIPQATDHDYIESQPAPTFTEPVASTISNFISNLYKKCNQPLNEEELESINKITAMNKSKVCQHLMKIDGIKEQLLNELMMETAQATNQLRNRKLFYISQLMKKTPEDLKSFKWSEIVAEFLEKFPSLMMLILSVVLPPSDMIKTTSIQKILPRIGTIYGILMQTRNKELSRFQRVVSLFLFDNICDQKVFDRLNTVGVCLSYGRSLALVDLIGGHFNHKVVELVKKQKRFRIIGDNINWSVGVHDQRLDNKSKMFHAFGSAIIVQNINFSYLPNLAPQRDYLETPVRMFLTSESDQAKTVKDYVILMSRVVFKHIPFFQQFKEVVPKFISHPCSPNLKTKSEVVPLPVLFKNEQYYQDVVCILEFYEKILKDAHEKAGVELEGCHFHIGGDLLTRERFSGAKMIRADHDYLPEAKFEHLSPITFELFHMLMAYLKMSNKILYNSESGQDMGTLKSVQERLSRTNIGDNINQHYEVNKEFFISVTDSYIVECFLEFFGMGDKYSPPTKNIPPEFENDENRKKWYFKTITDMVNEYVFCGKNGKLREESLQVDGHSITITLCNGKKVNLMKPYEKKEDHVHNYASKLLQLGLLFKDLIDMIKMPERSRGIRLLKLTLLYLKGNNNKSKYAFDILRLLTHQICILTEKEANEEFYGLFVNTAGKYDSHIPADRRMEYLVKEVKEHIKHMYANKTEKNITNRTRAISGIRHISENFDNQSGAVIRAKKHLDKSAEADELEIIKDLRSLRPFNVIPGRHHSKFPKISASVTPDLDVAHFYQWIDSRKTQFALETGN